jgi:hypothetical protein
MATMLHYISICMLTSALSKTTSLSFYLFIFLSSKKYYLTSASKRFRPTITFDYKPTTTLISQYKLTKLFSFKAIISSALQTQLMVIR